MDAQPAVVNRIQSVIIHHLTQLTYSLAQYFPELQRPLDMHEWVLNPFLCDVHQMRELLISDKEFLIDLQHNEQLKMVAHCHNSGWW